MALPTVRCGTSGPTDARIVFLGEAPGREEAGKTPFLGRAGQLLDGMLFDVKLPRESLFLTNVTPFRPENNKIETFFLDSKLTKPGPEIEYGLSELRQQLAQVKPNLVVAMGNVALWAMRGHRKITSWRGSILEATQPGFEGLKVLPLYHPAAIDRQWSWRFITIQDLYKVKREAEFREIRYPPWRFKIRPTYQEVIDGLDALIAQVESGPVKFAVDIETRLREYISCVGIAWSRHDCVTIPFIEGLTPYFTLQQEFEVVKKIRYLFRHKNALIVGQNFSYDTQYFAKHWGLLPNCWMDTMLAHHVCWPGLPKKLDFLSSMYCDFHQYWKEDGKDFDFRKHKEEQLWTYNSRDCVSTYEVGVENLDHCIDDLNRRPQYEFQMRRLYPAVQKMMLHGVYIDKKLRGDMAMQTLDAIGKRQWFVDKLAQRPINFQSPKQLRELFYDDFKFQKVYNKKSKPRDDGSRTPTVDEDALEIFMKRDSLYKPLCGAIIEARTLGNAMNVINAPLDDDGRMRSSYNPCGAETFRFSSSKNPFNRGTNLQNVTVGGRSEYTNFILPNMRRLMAPTPGCMIAEGDLDRADLQVVVWEADDDELKFALLTGMDIHLLNARTLYKLPISDDDLRNPESIKAFAGDVSRPYYRHRQVAKVFCHATNYLGAARTVAQHCGLGVRETENMQRLWFGQHPGIPAWHSRIAQSLAETRSVSNKFGYVRFYFDRIEDCLSEAVAWIPQSTVAIVINHVLVNVHENMGRRIDIVMQTHDSFTFEYLLDFHPSILRELYPHTQVVIPYNDPLIIPMSFKCSETSWGECSSKLIPSNLFPPNVRRLAASPTTLQ